MTIEQLENFINQCFSILSEEDFIVTIVNHEVVIQAIDECVNKYHSSYSSNTGIWSICENMELIEDFDSFKLMIKTLKKLS